MTIDTVEFSAERIADYIMQDIWPIPEDARGALDTLQDKAQAAVGGEDDVMEGRIIERLYGCAVEIGISEGAQFAGLDASKCRNTPFLHDIYDTMTDGTQLTFRADSDDVWQAVCDYAQSAIAYGVCVGIRYAAALRDV